MPPLSPSDVKNMKNTQKIVAISLSTAPLAHLADPLVDIILVGDSLAMTLFNLSSTQCIDVPTMTRHGKAVALAASHALVIIDMPFKSYDSPQIALENAQHFLENTKAHAVKVEGGTEMTETIKILVSHDIPVCAHIGLLPQSIPPGQKFTPTGHSQKQKNQLLNDAIAVENAGAFAVVLEAIVEPLAKEISQTLSIPTIGIGASPQCDGQVIVAEDILGFSTKDTPRFVKQYAQIHAHISHAFSQYAKEVRNLSFPEPKHCYYEPKKKETS